MFKTMVVFLKPVIPGLADKAEQFLETGPLSWQDIFQPMHKERAESF